MVGVETLGERSAVADSDGVAAGEGDDVGWVEVFGGERVKDDGGVAGRRREVV